MKNQLNQNRTLYQQGLEDPRWRRLRVKIIERDLHRCLVCEKNTDLHVHHRQYHRDKTTGEWSQPWEYHPKLLVTLCDNCHSIGHKNFPIPIKNI